MALFYDLYLLEQDIQMNIIDNYSELQLYHSTEFYMDFRFEDIQVRFTNSINIRIKDKFCEPDLYKMEIMSLIDVVCSDKGLSFLLMFNGEKALIYGGKEERFLIDESHFDRIDIPDNYISKNYFYEIGDKVFTKPHR